MSEIIRGEDGVIVIPETDIVADEVQTLKDDIMSILEDAPKQITIDLTKVEMLDSSGIGIFISTQNSLLEKSSLLKVINLSDDIFKMFKIMRLDKHFEITGRC